MITHEHFMGVEGEEGGDADAEMAASSIPAIPKEETKDNRNIADNNQAQKMKHADVEYLKETNIDG